MASNNNHQQTQMSACNGNDVLVLKTSNTIEDDRGPPNNRLQQQSKNQCIGNGGATPGSLFKEEAEHLLGIFSEGIWNTILDNVSDPKDLTNLSNSSLFFRNLLYPERVRFLFPKVWEIISVKMEKYLQAEHDENIQNKFARRKAEIGDSGLDDRKKTAVLIVTTSEKDAPWYSEILKLRLVCRRWWTAIDNFYQHLDLLLESDELRESNASISWKERQEIGKWINFNFYELNIGDFEKFIRHFEETHDGDDFDSIPTKCPFFGRIASFGSCPTLRKYELDFDRELRVGVTRILLRYGHHLWYCGIHIEDRFSSPTKIAYYLQLKDWLLLMPNLKELSISYWDDNRFSVPGERNNNMSDKVDSLLQTELTYSRLPKLDQLRKLSLADVPHPIVKMLVRQNHHIVALTLTRDPHARERQRMYNFKKLCPLPKLRELSINILSMDELKKLEIPQVKWRLRKLNINLSHLPSVDWNRVRTLLVSKWFGYLTYLTIGAYCKSKENNEDMTKIVEQMNLIKRVLPFLKRFTLKVRTGSSLYCDDHEINLI